MKSMMKSAFGGESFFVNVHFQTFRRMDISGSPSPGDIETIDLDPGQSFYMQGGAFMASTINVDTSTKFQLNLCFEKGLSSCVQRLLMSRAKFSSRPTGL